MKNTFLKWAADNNWHIKPENTTTTLPASILTRYPALPEEWLSFIRDFSTCINPSETSWFLTFADYFPKSDEEWRYNEFELMSLDAAEDDDEWKQSITAFWNQYFPIILCVGDGYEYYAIDTQTGNIVHGTEPEFEEVELIADSFNDFLTYLINEEIQL